MTPLLLQRRTLLTAVAAAALPRVAAEARAPELPFVVFGDWGREGAHDQRAVGVTMGRAAAACGSRFTLNVGDNFYENGVGRAGFAVERHGFVVARLSRDALRLRYTDVDGRVLRTSLLQRL